MFNNLRTVQLQPGNDNLGSGLRNPWPLRQPIPRQWLVWEWLLNGNAGDSSGYGNNGTATNVTYSDTDIGYYRQGAVFSGSAYITSSYNPQLTSTTPFSFCCWINSTNTNATKWLIVNGWFWSGGNNNAWLLSKANNTPNFVLHTGGNYSELSSGVSCNDWKWHFVVWTFDWATNRKIYVDGILANSNTYTTSWNFYNGLTKMTIGNVAYEVQPWIYSYTWNIALWRLYTRLLTLSQIKTLYKEWLKLLH